MKACILLFIILLSIQFGFAQEPTLLQKEENGLCFIVQVGYNLGVGNINIQDDFVAKNNGYLVRLRTSLGYFIRPQLLLSLGTGIEGYHDPSYNLLPIAVKGRYFVRPSKKSIFLSGDAGYSVKLGDQFKAGAYTGLAVGYRIVQRNKTSILVCGGIDLHQIRNARSLIFNLQNSTYQYVESSFWLKSFSINAAFVF